MDLGDITLIFFGIILIIVLKRNEKKERRALVEIMLFSNKTENDTLKDSVNIIFKSMFGKIKLVIGFIQGLLLYEIGSLIYSYFFV
jgi:hypothetical protein